VATLWLVAAEIAVRVLHPTGDIPYFRGDGERAAFATHVHDHGSAEVAIVGSSRAREGVTPPKLRRHLAALGTRATVENYGISDGRGEDVEAVVQQLMRSSPRPKVIVLGMSPRELTLPPERPSQGALSLWRLANWWDYRRTVSDAADSVLAAALRNELALASHLFRLRREVYAALHRTTAAKVERGLSRAVRQRQRPSPSQMTGGKSAWHRGKKTYESKRVSQRHIRKYLEHRHQEPAWPWTYEVTHVERAIALCQREGIPVVLFEVPVSPALHQAYPPRAYPGFQRAMAHIAKKRSVEWLTTERLGLALSQEDFREQSHLNFRGAKKLTLALAPHVAEALSTRGSR
jgi:hypothetical protein